MASKRKKIQEEKTPEAGPVSFDPESQETLPRPEDKQSDKTKMKQEAAKQETMEEELREIYEGDDGKLPDLTVLEKTKSRRTRNILILLVAFFAMLAAAAWAGFFVFKPFDKFRGAGVALSLSGPDSLVSGREVTFIVRYENREQVPIGSLEIVLTVPDSFQVTEAEPAPTEGNRWVLGSVPIGGGGRISLRGRVTGGLGETSGLQAFATYIPANFNSEFQSVGSYSAPIVSSTVTASSSLPESALPGDEVTYSLSYENTGESPISEAAVKAVYPEHFLFHASEPAVSEGNDLWKIGEIPPGGSGTLSVRGAFAAEAGGPAEFSAVVGRLTADKPLAVYVVASSTIQIIGGELRTTLIINGSNKGQPVNFGDTLRLSLVYENEGTEAIKNVELALNLDASPEDDGKSVIDWDTLVDENEGKRQGEVVRWTKKEIAVLGNLAPGAEGTIDLSVKLAEAPLAVEDPSYRIGAWIETQIGSIGSRKVDRSVRTGTLDFPINSDARLSSGARYYNEDEIPMGTGPLPPKVGETTSLRVFWSFSNSLHELSNLVVATTLPEGVTWTNKVLADAGEVRYDPETRRITWTINRIPTSIAGLGANFEVSVTPALENVGSLIQLTDPVTFDADDLGNQSHLTRSAPKLDSNLEGDPVASGRGVVVK